MKRGIFDSAGWYTHNGDRKLAKELGLLDFDYFPREETSVGVVRFPQGLIEPEYARVEVFVTALPAQFFRFRVTRKSETEEYGWETFDISTGSGGLSDYWPIAYEFARGMFNIKSVPALIARDDEAGRID